MAYLFVIGEDALCCALGTKLATDVVGRKLPELAVNTNGVTKLKSSLSRYLGIARLYPVLCIADTDGACAPQLIREWLPGPQPHDFFLRLAAPESESWLMADHDTFASYFRVPPNRVPRAPDMAVDAKRVFLNLARASKRREIRVEVASPTDPSRPGPGYNLHLCDYVANHWRPRDAAANSPSLARAISRLEGLRAPLPRPRDSAGSAP